MSAVRPASVGGWRSLVRDVNRPKDVVVIGAGVIGCSIAYELSRRDVAVQMVDARGVARGATQASAGILAPYIEGHQRTGLLELGARSLAMYDTFVERVVADSGWAIQYSRTGTLEVAVADEPAERLGSVAQRLRAEGIKCDFLDAAAAREVEPHLAPDIAGALLVHDHGFVAAADLTQALVAAAGRHRATISTGNVRRIAPEGAAMRVDLDNGSLSAGAVVLAAGSWSGGITVEGIPPLPVRPVRGQLLQLGWPPPPLARVTWGAQCYLVPWRDGSLLVGATVEDVGFDERTTVTGVRDLLDAVCELVPRAWQAGFTAARVGLRPASPDELPIVGRSERVPALMYATAHYRNGVLLAPLTAKVVSEAIVDGSADPALAAMAPGRFGEY